MANSVFITGGARGIGAACVRKFYHEGWNVAFIDVNESAGLELLKELDDPERLWFRKADVKNFDEMKSAAEDAAKAVGPFNALFSNAGIHRCNTMLNVDFEEFDLMIKTNIYGTFHTLRAVVPGMIENGGGAVVINDSDQ